MKKEKQIKINELNKQILECEFLLNRIKRDNDKQYVDYCKKNGLFSFYEDTIRINKNLLKELSKC